MGCDVASSVDVQCVLFPQLCPLDNTVISARILISHLITGENVGGKAPPFILNIRKVYKTNDSNVRPERTSFVFLFLETQVRKYMNC